MDAGDADGALAVQKVSVVQVVSVLSEMMVPNMVMRAGWPARRLGE